MTIKEQIQNHLNGLIEGATLESQNDYSGTDWSIRYGDGYPTPILFTADEEPTEKKIADLTAAVEWFVNEIA